MHVDMIFQFFLLFFGNIIIVFLLQIKMEKSNTTLDDKFGGVNAMFTNVVEMWRVDLNHCI